MLPVGSVCTPCCMLLCVVGSCCAKFETSQTFSHVQMDTTTACNLACVAFVSISFAPLHPIPSRFSCTSPTWLKVDRNDCYACYPGYWTHICCNSFPGYNSFVLGIMVPLITFFVHYFPNPILRGLANQAICSNSVNS